MKNWKSVETTKKEVVNFYLIWVWISKRKYMEVIADVIFEMGSIILMGIVFFVLYVYGKLFLIKIGLIDAEEVDESQKGDEPDRSMWNEILRN